MSRDDDSQHQAATSSDASLSPGIYIAHGVTIARFEHERVARRQKIVDTFIFRDELDLLELRLEELADVVDYFVLVESNRTWSGADKPFIFRMHEERFAKWRDKIIYYEDSIMPPLGDADTIEARKILEAHQRDSIGVALQPLNLSDDDIVLISDVDELPRREYIPMLNCMVPPNTFVTFVQKMYVGYINNVSSERLNLHPWAGTVASRYKHFRSVSPTVARFKEIGASDQRAGLVIYHLRFDNELYIEDGGWHFSYFGGIDHAKFKMSTLVETAGTIARLSYSSLLPSRHNYRGFREQNTDYLERLAEDRIVVEPLSPTLNIEGSDLPKVILDSPHKYERFFFLKDTLD